MGFGLKRSENHVNGNVQVEVVLKNIKYLSFTHLHLTIVPHELINYLDCTTPGKMNARSDQYRVEKVVGKLFCYAIPRTTKRTAALNDKLCVL